MTRQEYKNQTVEKIRNSNTGKDVAEAFIEYFKKYGPKKKPPMTTELATEVFEGTPLYEAV